MFDPANAPLLKPLPNGYYFFDRDPDAFRSILNGFRRAMEPRRPDSLSEKEWTAELRFWGLLVVDEPNVPPADAAKKVPKEPVKMGFRCSIGLDLRACSCWPRRASARSFPRCL